MRLADVRDRQWAADTMQIVGAALLILGALEVGQYVLKRPAGVTELPPVIVVLMLAADVEQAVDRARSAHHLAAWLDDLPVIQFRFRFGLIEPIHSRVVEELGEAERHMNPEMAVMAASFQQQYAVTAGCRQAIGENAAGRAGAYDDVIEMLGIVVGHGRFTPRRQNTVIAPSRQQYGQ